MLQFDEKNAQLLTADPGMLKALEDGIQLRVSARVHKDKATELEKKANKLLAPVLTALDVSSVRTQYGTLAFLQNTTSKSVSREGMEKWLVEHGVSPTLIAEAREASTQYRTTEYQVKFTPVKEK